MVQEVWLQIVGFLSDQEQKLWKLGFSFRLLDKEAESVVNIGETWDLQARRRLYNKMTQPENIFASWL